MFCSYTAPARTHTTIISKKKIIEIGDVHNRALEKSVNFFLKTVKKKGKFKENFDSTEFFIGILEKKFEAIK